MAARIDKIVISELAATDPRTNVGIAFLVLFSVMHKIGLFSTKIEVIRNAMAHLSSPKI